MAMIVRLLNNRRNPCRGRCRGLLDHLKLRPCNFIQTQTLSSTRSLPFSPPTPSTEIPAFEPTSQHHRDLFSTGGILVCICSFVGFFLNLFIIFIYFIENRIFHCNFFHWTSCSVVARLHARIKP